MTELIWTEMPCGHVAYGAEDREYMVIPLGTDNPWNPAEIPWAACTTAGRHPRKLWSIHAAQRLCQTWEDVFRMADERLAAGDLDMAQRLAVEQEEQ